MSFYFNSHPLKHVSKGLYMSKFMAYHKGHQAILNYSLNHCETLNLVINSCHKTDKVPLRVRRKWLEDDLIHTFKTRTHKIKLFTNIYDEQKDNTKEIFSNIVNLIGGKPDIIFGKNEYVEKYSLELGCEFNPDNTYNSMYKQELKEIFNQDISSETILQNGLKYYDHLALVSKPYFNKKVLIVGSESTGKTILSKSLANYFNGKFVPEYGRQREQYTIQQFKKTAAEWTIDEYINVCLTQNEIIEEEMKNPIRLLFVDTDAMITEMYSQLLIKQTSKIFNEIIKNQKYDLILYLESNNTTWVNDGIRFMQHKREETDELIKDKLKKYNREYIILDNREGYDSRNRKAKEIIKEKFQIKH
jgi:HTH-type transcriptional repressor of NAD biosynthesis genes